LSVNAVVQRGFVDLPHGQMHYRFAGEAGEPILLLHASPGSSCQLVRLIEDLAGESRVFAPDTPGNGDSVALPAEDLEIADLAQATLAFLDAAGLERVRVYGSHTGAAIAAELAILAPERVARVVLDGISLMEGAELEEVLATYAYPFVPDLDGAYLIRLFQFVRDQYLFFPWYRRTKEARRDSGLGSPEDMHAWVVEVMKAATTYHRNYRAAFRWPADHRLPLISCPVLVTAAANDPLRDTSARLAPLPADSRFAELPRFDALDFRSRRHDVIATFLAGES
jgi:pimeloyl-ACP methyl ester carboxylesterase